MEMRFGYVRRNNEYSENGIFEKYVWKGYVEVAKHVYVEGANDWEEGKNRTLWWDNNDDNLKKGLKNKKPYGKQNTNIKQDGWQR